MQEKQLVRKNTDIQTAINTIFDERKRFIVIGLTGRTGTGCSTAADLLACESFEKFSPPKPETVNFLDDDARRYKIAYEYLENNWSKFKVIRLRDLISSFLLEKDVAEFILLYAPLVNARAEDVESKIDNEFKLMWNELHALRIKIMGEVEESEENLLDEHVAEFYFEQLPKFTESARKALDGFNGGSFTRFYQLSANNIRRSGDAYSSRFHPSHIYRLSQRARMLIKLLRKRSKQTGERVLVCLDAIRNPFEAQFFRERYSSFYLLAVSSSNEQRKGRLRNELDLSESEIERIDNKEHPSKLKEEELFYSQNIQRCVELSDIHIPNHDDNKTFRELKRNLVKYLSLMMHPGLFTPSRPERCMQIAYTARLNSGCISRQVGAVVTDGTYSVKSVGWNNVAYNQVPCALRNVSDLLRNEDDVAFSEYEKNNKEFREVVLKTYGDIDAKDSLGGRPFSFCFKEIQNALDGEKNQVHTRSLHAEENAFLQISKNGGVGVQGGVLFTTASPCELCSKKAYQLGIKKIVYIDPYPGIAHDHILKSGTERPDMELFAGAIGRAYQQLFEPLMAYKDESSMLLATSMPNIKSDLRARIAELEHKNRTLEAQIISMQQELKQSALKVAE